LPNNGRLLQFKETENLSLLRHEKSISTAAVNVVKNAIIPSEKSHLISCKCVYEWQWQTRKRVKQKGRNGRPGKLNKHGD